MRTIQLIFALLLAIAVPVVVAQGSEVDLADTAILFKGHLRRLEELADFWKWFVEAEGVDVYIVTQSPTIDKNGALSPVDTSLVTSTFGSRLKLLHIVEDGTVEHQFLQADLDRVASYLPESEGRKKSPGRHYAHYWLVHRAFAIAGEALSRYKRIAAMRTDFIQATVMVDPTSLVSPDHPQPVQLCPRNRESWPHFQFMSYLKSLEPLVSNATRWGFSISDYYYYGPPETLLAMSLLRDWMWVRVPLEGTLLRRAGNNAYSSEAQFYLQRVTQTNMTDLRDLGVAMATVVVREAGCEVRHAKPQVPYYAEKGFAVQMGKFADAQALSARSMVLWADPSVHHPKCLEVTRKLLP